MESLTRSARPAAMALPASPDSGLESLLRQRGTPRIVQRRETIYAIADPASHVYLLERGEIALSRVTHDGRELTLETLRDGDPFGEIEVLLGCHRVAQAVALTESVLFQLHRDEFVSLAVEQPDFGIWLMQRIGERQLRLAVHVETLLFTSACAKVAKVLLQLAERHGKRTATGVLIDCPITHQEIGNLIATTRETVSYTFMDLRERGLISTHHRKTIILDPAALSEIASA